MPARMPTTPRTPREKMRMAINASSSITPDWCLRGTAVVNIFEGLHPDGSHRTCVFALPQKLSHSGSGTLSTIRIRIDTDSRYDIRSPQAIKDHRRLGCGNTHIARPLRDRTILNDLPSTNNADGPVRRPVCPRPQQPMSERIAQGHSAGSPRHGPVEDHSVSLRQPSGSGCS